MQHETKNVVLTPSEAADYLKLPVLTLASWRAKKRGPVFIRVGRLVRYRQADLNAFIDAGRQSGGQA